MDRLATTFTVERLLKLVVAAVAVGLLLRLAQFVLQRGGTPASKNEIVFLGTGVMVFLLVTDAISDITAAIAYATVLVTGYCLSKFANRLFK